MANDISGIGNNVGFLYITAPDGTTILSTEKNTVQGAKSIRSIGAVAAPLAAQRSAYGKITVTACASAGNITAITVNGIAQISENIAIVTSNNTTLATTIANAINSYSAASGADYTAQAIGAVVYLFAPASYGSTVNGHAVVFTASVGSTTATTVAVTGGSSETGNYDSVLGFRFWINATGTATETSLSGAVEITKYISLRGTQAGIVSKDITISSDRLTGIDRSCNQTVLNAIVESGSADTVAFIETVDFIPGDFIYIRTYDTAKIVTVESAPVTTSSVATPNIYLSNNAPFVTSVYNTLTLQLKNDATLGNIWIEAQRTVTPSNAVIVRTQSQIATDITNGVIQPGGTYLISDKSDAGIILQGVYKTGLSKIGTAIYWNADYQAVGAYPVGVVQAGIWNSGLAVTINVTAVIDNNLHYKNITGTNTATAPHSDATNWQLMSKAAANGYLLACDTVEYATVGTDAGSVLLRMDSLLNVVKKTAISTFMWGNAKVYNNTIDDVAFDIRNQTGYIYNNEIHTAFAPIISGSFYNNYIGYGCTLTTFKVTGTFYYNTINDLAVVSLTVTSGSPVIGGCTIAKGGFLTATMVGGSINECFVDSNGSLTVVLTNASSGISNVNIYEAGTVTYTSSSTNTSGYLTITGSSVIITTTGTQNCVHCNVDNSKTGAALTMTGTHTNIISLNLYASLTLLGANNVTITGKTYRKDFDYTLAATITVGNTFQIPDTNVPNGAIIGNNAFKFTSLDGGAGATVSLGITTDDVAILKAATVFGTLNSLKYTSQQSNTAITTGERLLLLTVAVADITAGRIRGYFEALIL